VLIAAGYNVKPWYEHFPGQEDVDWLPPVGVHGWILLTKDKNIRRNTLEIHAILNSGVRAFVLTATALRKEEQAEVFLKAMPKIGRICVHPGPFIFNVTRMGYLSRISTKTLRRRQR